MNTRIFWPLWTQTIFIIGWKEECTAKQLSVCVNVTQNNMCPVINEMVKKGIIVKILVAEDRRIRKLKLTPKGNRVYNNIKKIKEAVQDE